MSGVNEAGPGRELADEELRRLVHDAMSEEESARVDVLAGVQRRLHERSGGKFYRDRWSTSRGPLVSTYFITALMMIAVVVVLYLLLTTMVADPLSPGAR